MTDNLSFLSIENTISHIANGKKVILYDDCFDDILPCLAQAAHFITPEDLLFFEKVSKKEIFMALSQDHIKASLTSLFENVDTGSLMSISFANLQNEKRTIYRQWRSINAFLQLQDSNTQGDEKISVSNNKDGDLSIFLTKKMGVMQRPACEEAITDLARLAHLSPAGMIVPLGFSTNKETIKSDVLAFSQTHKIPIVKISDLILFRKQSEHFITLIKEEMLETKIGQFYCYHFFDELNNKVHFALTKGEINNDIPLLVRLHSECLTGDVFYSQRCDCGNQLENAMKAIEKEGRGLVLYLRQEGRGIGLANKIKAYKYQEKGLDTVEANLELGFDDDMRDYGVGAQMLMHLNIDTINLMTNNPRKVAGLKEYGIKINDRLPIIIESCEHNKAYLGIKQEKLGHLFPRI